MGYAAVDLLTQTGGDRYLCVCVSCDQNVLPDIFADYGGILHRMSRQTASNILAQIGLLDSFTFYSKSQEWQGDKNWEFPYLTDAVLAKTKARQGYWLMFRILGIPIFIT